MTTISARGIDRDEAVRLLERTDTFNNYRGLGRPSGNTTPLVTAVLIADSQADRFQLRPATAKGYKILEMRLRDKGWVQFFVFTAAVADEPAQWP